eukprot:scaffold2428_cov80-Isochrysis_galbana.AAC.3
MRNPVVVRSGTGASSSLEPESSPMRGVSDTGLEPEQRDDRRAPEERSAAVAASFSRGLPNSSETRPIMPASPTQLLSFGLQEVHSGARFSRGS